MTSLPKAQRTRGWSSFTKVTTLKESKFLTKVQVQNMYQTPASESRPNSCQQPLHQQHHQIPLVGFLCKYIPQRGKGGAVSCRTRWNLVVGGDPLYTDVNPPGGCLGLERQTRPSILCVTQTSQELRMLSRSLSDCESLLLNVMIQVLQFIRNGQLCH